VDYCRLPVPPHNCHPLVKCRHDRHSSRQLTALHKRRNPSASHADTAYLYTTLWNRSATVLGTHPVAKQHKPQLHNRSNCNAGHALPIKLAATYTCTLSGLLSP
jgi:hypothetical protein